MFLIVISPLCGRFFLNTRLSVIVYHRSVGTLFKYLYAAQAFAFLGGFVKFMGNRGRLEKAYYKALHLCTFAFCYMKPYLVIIFFNRKEAGRTKTIC